MLRWWLFSWIVIACVACSKRASVEADPDAPAAVEGPRTKGQKVGGGEGAAASGDEPKENRARRRLERYPRMVTPGQVTGTRQFSVFVGVAEKASSASYLTRVRDGDVRGDKIVLELPELPDGVDAWTIDVLLAAPDFDIVGGDDMRSIELPEAGNSTMARFDLQAHDDVVGEVDLEAYLFHQGTYMGIIGRTIRVLGGRGQDAAGTVSPGPDALALKLEETDVGAVALRSEADASAPVHEITFISLNETQAIFVAGVPGRTPAHAIVDFDSGTLDAFLGPKWSAIRSRGIDAPQSGDPVGMGMIRGLGAQLWEKVPNDVKAHVLDLYGDAQVQDLRLYTNLPGFPWEIVRPKTRQGEELEPLGMRFRLGRWHVRTGMMGLVVPPERLQFSELVAMVPAYEGSEALPALEREVDALKTISAAGFRTVGARSGDLMALMQDPPNGVVHFAGHGTAKETEGQSTAYALRLEDGAFDSLAFVGLEGKKLASRETLIFFNACELGKTENVASIVEGWAPAVLDAGASGYIGALWPIGDDEAASFAEAFYAEIERSIQMQGEVRVTEVLRCLRRRGATRSDPTWQAYVFYGDPQTSLYSPSADGAGDGTYVCE